jgi:DNA invertase Pin-like site-specific DNA recombinase
MDTGKEQVRAGAYVRISKYEGEGRSGGTKRQEADCRAECKRLGWKVVDVFVDDDRSAFNGKARPEYDRMLDAIDGGRLDAVIAWHQDRFTRDPMELEVLLLTTAKQGVILSTVVGGVVDPENGDSKTLARISGVLAAAESEAKSRRLRRKALADATEGKANGGRRPFGWENDRLTPHPVEAPVVAELVDRVAAGESLASLADDLNRRGISTPEGKRWSSGSTIRRIVVNPRHAGRRVHVRSGSDVEAVWPAIVDHSTWRRAQARLSDPSRAQQRRPRRFLLVGGLLRCGKCGAGMISFTTQRPSGRRFLGYRCPHPRQGGCLGVSIAAEPLEELVTAAVLDYVGSATFAKVLRARASGGRDELAAARAIEAEADDLARLLGRGKIKAAQYAIAEAELERRLETARAALSTDVTTAAVGKFAGKPGALEAAWVGMALDQRRAAISAVVDHVTIAPSNGQRAGRNGIVESRVHVDWR